MKSIIQNGKTVEQATAKAWEAAGKPEEFTIKILDAGEIGFLGFSKRPAIISITYQPQAQQSRRDVDYRRRRGRTRQDRFTKPQLNRPASQQQLQERFEVRPQQQETKPVERKAPERTISDEPCSWEGELAQTAKQDLGEMLKLMGFDIAITSELNGKSLTLQLGNDILPNIMSERTLCASFSYLILQTVKRKIRKKLRGFRLRIEPHARQGTSEDSSSQE